MTRSDPPDPAIDVCICSYRRPQIAQTLAALSAQTVPGESFHVIVTDNTREGSSRDLILGLGKELSLNLHYVHAPSDNISIARNACLDAGRGAWLAFIDDDEMPVENWLSALVEEQQRGQWDAVLGPVIAIYDETAPEWLRRTSLHSTKPVWRNGAIVTGYAGNVLFRRALAERHALRFRIDLGTTGGEDDDFFHRFRDAGGSIGYAPTALCYERVDSARADLAWVLRRKVRAGRSHALRLRRQSNRAFAALAAGGKALYCGAGAAMHISDAISRNRCLARGALHAGVVSGLLKRPANGQPTG